MGFDLRQVVAAILTITMFVMLAQMMKRDYYDSVQEKLRAEGRDVQFDHSKVAIHNFVKPSVGGNGQWMEDDDELKPCWKDTTFDDEVGRTKGYITFSLTNGAEYHVSQIADAAVIARRLEATLVLPDIRGSKPGDERDFRDIYDVDKFIKSMKGMVRVVKELPDEVSIRNLAIVKVPTRVTEDYIEENIKPVFAEKKNIRIATYFPSVNLRISPEIKTDPAACLAMFGSLELQPEVSELVDSMVERLRTLSRKSDGRFVAVDLRVDILEKKHCHETGSGGTKTCYSAQEIAVFLRKIGFEADTTIYLTQPRWDSSLNILKDIFPKTYTKETIMPADKKSKYLESENSEYEKIIDFYISSRSDVFVPAIPGLFYGNVVGKRIALGKPQILVPADIAGTSATATDFISHYVSKRNHLAYSCYC